MFRIETGSEFAAVEKTASLTKKARLGIEDTLMSFVCFHEKKEIEDFLRKDIDLHIYSLGDLDDFFWPYTIWFGSKSDGNIDAIALVYVGLPLPTLLALSDEHDVMAELLISIQHLLPFRFYAHLSPGLESALDTTHDLESYGEYYKMALLDENQISKIDCSEVIRLGTSELASIRALYNESYPENWFDPRMLETNQYFGIKKEKRLVSIAGIHVYSSRYKVAALGNIATHPTHRKKGYGLQVAAKLCQSLSEEGMRIGLNVKTDNDAAISCYKKIGFEIVASYGEFLAQRKK